MFGFSNVSRLNNKLEFDFVFAKANRITTKEFIILYRKNTIGHARLGFALSKKIVAKANQRNRLKRIIRESFRTSPLPAIDLIFLARHNAWIIENPVIFTSLSQLWKKLMPCHAE